MFLEFCEYVKGLGGVSCFFVVYGVILVCYFRGLYAKDDSSFYLYSL